MEENKKPLSLIEKMKQRAQQQKNYGGEYIEEAAKVNARTCPNCGIETTLFWAISTAEVKKFEDMSVKQKLVFFLITGEPNTIIIHDEKGDKDD